MNPEQILGIRTTSFNDDDWDPMYDGLYYSTGSTNSLVIENKIWCTTYTNHGIMMEKNVVSKSIDIKKDEQVIETYIDDRPTHIYFRRSGREKPFCDPEFAKNAPREPVKILFCSAWSDLVDLLKTKPKTICVNAEELNYTSCLEIVNMINTLAKLASIDKITITLAVNKTTTAQQVKEAQKSEMFGIVPSSDDFDSEETSRALAAQWNQIPYWPKHIIDQLPGAKKPTSKSSGGIKLTPRQEQILDLIKERGASNKTIAKTLNISESTVKLHVGIVLKKFGVKNRTQLALFGKK